MIERPELTDADIDELLQRFDLTEPKLQRRIIARFLEDRELLLNVCERLWNDRDARVDDQAACRRLYNAWRDLGETIRLVKGA